MTTATVIPLSAREARLRLARTLRSTASYRHRKMAEGNYADTAEDRERWRANYRAMTAVQVAAVFVSTCLEDIDPDIEFARLCPPSTQGKLELAEPTLQVAVRFCMDREDWADGGPTETQVRELLRAMARSEQDNRKEA